VTEYLVTFAASAKRELRDLPTDVVYAIDDENNLVDIARIAHRREVYDR